MDPSSIVAAKIVVSFVASVVLAVRLSWGFDFVALCGVIVTYAYFLQGIADAWIQEWTQSLLNTNKPLNLHLPWIITLEAAAVVLLCAILLRLGRRYRLDNMSTSIAYKLAIAGIVLNAAYFIVHMIFIANIFTGAGVFVGFSHAQEVANLFLMLGPQIAAYLYAFTPSLRVMFAMGSARNPSNAIGAHRAAEGTWYAAFATLHLSQDMLNRAVACTSRDIPAIKLHETLHVVTTSLALVAFAMPVPHVIVEALERKYACRVTPKFEEPL